MGPPPSRTSRWFDSLRPVLVALLLTAATAVQAQPLESGMWCGTDLSSDAMRADLAAYARARDAGLLSVARKAATPPVIGEVRTFNILDGIDLNEDTSWGTRDFQLVEITDHYYQWVDVALWNGMAQPTRNVVLALDGPMITAAPAGAFRSGHGIIENDLYLFGDLPEFDDDGGIIDILMYDIEPGNNANGVTLGFVHSADINPNAETGVGNQRLVLYLDGKEGVSSIDRLAGVAAHELTHLIHYGERGEFPDLTFNMEGLAEYGMLANGYFWRGAGYLSDADEMALLLYTWRQEVRDYERASLFFGYLADRIGPEATGSIVRENGTGWIAVKDALAKVPGAPAFRDLVADFHTANLVNDPTLAPEFAHLPPHRSGIRAAVPPPINGDLEPRITTGSGVHVGSVHYRAWQNVRDFSFRFYLDPSNPDQAQFNGRMRARLLTTDTDGVGAWHDLTPSLVPTTIPGNFTDVILVLFNGSGATNYDFDVEYDASWQALSTANEPESGLPASVTLDPPYPNPFNPSTVIPYAIPAPGPVRLELYDLLGRRVRVLVDAFRSAGAHEVTLEADGLAGGTYLVVLEARGLRLTRSVTLLP